jgi:SAM-dependent methyltransferase
MSVRDVLKTFYDTYGWRRDQTSGRYRGEVLHEDLDAAAQRYMEANEARYRSCFAAGGDFFLDAGCGAEPRRRMAPDFRRHVCVDISVVGLKEARRQLGGTGLYVVSDLAALPFRSATFDGALASHCLYHVDKDLQPVVVRELYRAVRPSKVVLIFYASTRNLMSKLQAAGRAVVAAARAVRRRLRPGTIGRERGGGSREGAAPPLYYYTHDPAWLTRDFAETELTCLRTLTMRETRLLGKVKLLNVVVPALVMLERRLPRAMLAVGKYVAIAIRRGPGAPP